MRPTNIGIAMALFVVAFLFAWGYNAYRAGTNK